MPPETPDAPPLLLALVVLVGLSVCMIAAAVMLPTMLGGLGAWPVLVGGFVALIASLSALWVVQCRRDGTLR
jgi:hypothetical protein